MASDTLLINNLLVIPANRDHLRNGDGRAYVAFYGARNGKTFDAWNSSFMAPERAMRLRDRIMRRHKRQIEREAFIKFLAEALDGATGEGAISVHVRGSLVLLTELRNYADDGPLYEARYFHKLASWRTADKFAERDEAPLVKPQPKGVKAGCFDV